MSEQIKVESTPDEDTRSMSHKNQATPESTGVFKWIRSLYDWVISWADTPYGFTALLCLAFVESIIFPIPPDVLLIALVLGARTRWLRFALGCTIASFLGGLVGYGLGATIWDTTAPLFYEYVPGFTEQKFERIKSLYETWGFWVVFTAGFTPIPYKVITVSAGVFKVNLLIFSVASILSRGARFFIVAWLLKKYGVPIRTFIERKFNLLTILFTGLLIGGFLLIKILK